MIRLRPPAVEDADRMFPLVYHTEVTDTIQWDGPELPGRVPPGDGKARAPGAKR